MWVMGLYTGTVRPHSEELTGEHHGWDEQGQPHYCRPEEQTIYSNEVV
jgi:hypothetical protein